MRPIVYVLTAAAAFASCRAHKAETASTHRAVRVEESVADSVVRRVAIAFDTVYVEVERPAETVRVRAVNARATAGSIATRVESVDSVSASAHLSESKQEPGRPWRAVALAAFAALGAVLLDRAASLFRRK